MIGKSVHEKRKRTSVNIYTSWVQTLTICQIFKKQLAFLKMYFCFKPRKIPFQSGLLSLFRRRKKTIIFSHSLLQWRFFLISQSHLYIISLINFKTDDKCPSQGALMKDTHSDSWYNSSIYLKTIGSTLGFLFQH